MASILIVIALTLLAVGIVWLSVRWHDIWRAEGSLRRMGPPPVASDPAFRSVGGDDPFAHAPPTTPMEERS